MSWEFPPPSLSDGGGLKKNIRAPLRSGGMNPPLQIQCRRGRRLYEIYILKLQSREYV